VRDEMRRVWYSRWYGQVAALARDLRFAVRSLARAKALTVTVVVTLALGIGANAAIFSVVRSVLLRPLVNREADRLIYIRQDAQGLGLQSLTFSVPEINDFKSRATTIAAFGDFSTVDFTLIGFVKEPRLVKAGVVNGSFFEVMGLRPVLGRLLSPADDGAGAAGVLARIAGGFFEYVQLPGALPVIVAAIVLIGAAIGASLVPAARASRVDVLRALRSK
jgi:MacB-like periplasmic core domain